MLITGDDAVMTSDRLVLAGYMPITPAARLPGHEELLPDEFLTISGCLSDDRAQPEFWDWHTDRAEADRARTARAPRAEIITVHIQSNDALVLMRDHGGSDEPYYDLLRNQVELPRGSSVLGWEVIGVEMTLSFHSWHCHGYAPDPRDELGLRLNEYGLIPSYEQAVRVLDWMLAAPPEDQPAPVHWLPVALART